MPRVERIINITPWELMPGTSQSEVISHLDGDQYIEYVQAEKKLKRANAAWLAGLAQSMIIEGSKEPEPREEHIFTAQEVQEGLLTFKAQQQPVISALYGEAHKLRPRERV